MKKSKKKSSKHPPRCTTLEQLPTEILFDIFDYLTGNHIFKSFFALNQHFQELVYNASNVHLNLLRTKTKFFRSFPRVFNQQHIVSIVLPYENVNILERLFNRTDEPTFRSLSLFDVPLRAFENRISEILSVYKLHLISLKIHFSNMQYTGTGAYAARSFGYLLTELPVLKYLTLEHPQGIDSITYMPSTFINNTILNLTISLYNQTRLIPLLYRFEKLKVLTLHHYGARVKRAAPSDAIVSYRHQLYEKTSIDYLITVRHINLYQSELDKFEQVFQIIKPPNLLTLSFFTSKYCIEKYPLPKGLISSLNGKQVREAINRSLPSTIKRFHIEYEDFDETMSIANLQRLKKEFEKCIRLPQPYTIDGSYEQDKNLMSFDFFFD